MLLRKLSIFIWNRVFPAPAPPNIRLTRRSAFRDLGETRAALERLLVENIVPFWLPETVDQEQGGYRLNHDVGGRWRGPAPKRLVAQARMVWFFSRLSRSSYGDGATLAAARQGYEFVRASLWDQELGGFFWEVESEGRSPTMADKHLYGQAFALFAVAEYAKASADTEATTFALELFELLEDRFHDPVRGGYHEFLRRDWRPAPEGEPSYVVNTPAGLKSMNTHLHVMEALAPLTVLTSDRRVRVRLIEMILILSNAVVRKGSVTSCTDTYHPDWHPATGYKQDNVVYGHDLENITLLSQACAAAGLPNGPLLDLYGALFANALHYGWDRRDGGFFFCGPIGVPAINRTKIWWVQAEAMLAALVLFRLTGAAVYRDCYFETLDWIERRQADWDNGDWHQTITADGRIVGDKAYGWKAAYHNGRAVIESLALLDEIDGRTTMSSEPSGARYADPLSTD